MPSLEIPPQSRRQAFEEVISLVFNRWSAIRLVSDLDLGGDSLQTMTKIKMLQDLVCDFFEDYGMQASTEDLADNLLSYLSDTFKVDLEDGSADQIACTLVKYFEIVAVQGNGDGLLHLRHLNATKGPAAPAQGEASSDEESQEEDAMETAGPSQRQEPIVDEDGFTLVQSKKKGKR